jgi:protein involved in polysaccharide export with SLBB domain
MRRLVVNTLFVRACRRGIALGLAVCVAFPSVAVAQPPPGTTLAPVPGPAAAPPSPSAPPAIPADSILLRLGGARPDACAGFGQISVARVALPPDYRLGPGDQIDVQLAGRLEVVRQQVVVDPEGNISLPPLGLVHVDKLTPLEAQRLLNERLRTLFRFTDATLGIGTPRCFEVVLTGEVERPGSIQASAMRRVHDVILLSGGVTSRGSVRYVELIPKTGSPRTIDLLRFELRGDLSQNPLVEEGLRIHVPPRSGFVTLSGAVRRPGTYELGTEGGLRELLDLMGGLNQGAAASMARLTRLGPEGRSDSFGVDLPRVLAPPGDVALRPGDELYVPPGAVLQDVVEVRGAFNGTADSARTTTLGKPTVVQRFELAQGDRVRDVLVKAGGAAPLADLRLAVVERNGAGGPRRQIPIDLQRLLVEKEEFQNIALENGDVFILPPFDDRVYVLGEVRNPGAVDFRSGATIREYVALAGGPTVRARYKNAVITYRDGRSFPLSEAPPVEPGAIVSIPEVSVRWYQDYILILSAVASLITSYTGLYLLFGGKINTTAN